MGDWSDGTNTAKYGEALNAVGEGANGTDKR